MPSEYISAFTLYCSSFARQMYHHGRQSVCHISFSLLLYSFPHIFLLDLNLFWLYQWLYLPNSSIIENVVKCLSSFCIWRPLLCFEIFDNFISLPSFLTPYCWDCPFQLSNAYQENTATYWESVFSLFFLLRMSCILYFISPILCYKKEYTYKYNLSFVCVAYSAAIVFVEQSKSYN